ncbi:hypothetical protein SMICM17S_11286 [Streptomyces microflavus]
MGGDEVDRGVRAAAAPGVQVAGAGQPVAEIPYVGERAAPVVPYGVAVAVVPLGPQGREGPHLVAAVADVPRLGDQLDPAQHRVLGDHREERGEHVDVVHRAGQGRREVEAEAVDAHLGDPVAQRVGDEPQHLRLDHVEGVAAAGVVGVAAGVVLEAVVAAVVDAAQREHRAQLAGLGGVVVDDVEDDLDPGAVQGVHHPLELADLPARRAGGGVAGVRGEVADGVVAPVVVQPAPQQMVLVGELVDRQQFDGGHPQPGQVVDRGRVRESGVRAAQLGRDVRVELGEAAYVEFVDDGVGPRGLGAAVLHPVVVIVDDDALGHVRSRVPVVPYGVGDMLVRPVPYVPVDLRRQGEVAVDRTGVRVEQQLGRVPAGARPGVPAAVHPVAVALTGRDARQEAVPDLVGQLGQRAAGLGAVLVEEAQLDRLGATGPEREVGARHPVRTDPEAGPERHRRPGPHDGRPGLGPYGLRGLHAHGLRGLQA